MPIFLSVGSLVSCRNGLFSGKKIPFDTLRVIVWDMACADSWNEFSSQRDSLYKTNKDKHALDIYATVFKIHHVTSDQFYQALAPYKRNPEIMLKLLDSVSVYGDRMTRYFGIEAIHPTFIINFYPVLIPSSPLGGGIPQPITSMSFPGGFSSPSQPPSSLVP